MSTLDASHMTKRRRSSELAGIREAVSGGEKAAAVQLEDELDKEGRKKLMTDSEFRKKITTEDALAMKATLALPWNKLRIMRRYNYCNYTCTHTPHYIHNVLYKYCTFTCTNTDGSKRMTLSSQVRSDREPSHLSFLETTWPQKWHLSLSACSRVERTYFQHLLSMSLIWWLKFLVF